MEKSPYDVVIIGAGLSGIVTARFYLDIHPESNVAILEGESVIGGVWSSERQYKGFWSQSGLRMTGFSDVPLRLPEEAKMYHDTLEAKYVTEYLEEYVDSHVYNGQTIRDRIIFGFQVSSLEKTNGIWIIKGASESSKTIQASKFVIATGHTNIPNLPTVTNEEHFQSRITHQKDFGRVSRESPTSYTNVAVLGGGKSAADMVYDSVKAGKNVSWIIRRSGAGPAAFAAVNSRGRYRNGAEMSATRFFAALSPSCFVPRAWWTGFIHHSAVCRWIVGRIWRGADRACVEGADFEGRVGKLPGFGGLRSTTEIFWASGPVGSLQQDDFWEVVARNVRVYRRDVDRLEARTIVLEDGVEVSADILFCGTGWRHTYPFLTTEQIVSLGLPHSLDEEPESVAGIWRDLMHDADKQVLSDFPILANPPKHIKPKQSTTPARLYNGIAPLDDNTIVFVGQTILSNSFRPAEAQAIWITAYFDGHVKLPVKEEAMRQVAYMNAFSARRYPLYGARGNYFHLDLVGYTDRLMEEVGVVSHRGKGAWGDFVEPCLAGDYGGCYYRK
ncbi:hypothetical protein HYFRA_00006301 [Hymenoscyphus fraxineus]|uniref:Uncharacterized protein n=1 Tax=Hymenoscyphus fraxineus TaxID=746836 RepID=A0A9N9LBY2_9HELO|nr:hypothetical protein HYFRA_00006301 [Hymenoscyphus fraxineus]